MADAFDRLELRRLDQEIARLKAREAELVEALKDCWEYFDQRADAEYFTSSLAPRGNEEMRLLCIVNDALATHKPASDEIGE